MQMIDILLEIAEKAGFFSSAEFTTARLAKGLGVSQQTVSNSLRRLESEGLIRRKPSNNGTMVSISPSGREWLDGYRKRLSRLDVHPKKIIGRVFKGMGQGSFYIRQAQYMKKFISMLGIRAFPGTLNVHVDPVKKQEFLSSRKYIFIEGFKTKNRAFGWLKCYPVQINRTRGAIVIPERTHYMDDTIELIAEKDLRKELKLKDGDRVTIR